MCPVGMAWRRSNVSPKISSHSAGWIARVISSVRSWRIFWTSTRQNVAIRLPSHFHAGGLGGSAMAASAEAAGDAPGATNVTELPSFLERVAGVVTEHVLERGLGTEARLELGRRTHGANAAAVHERHAVAQLLRLFHVVRREEHGDPLRLQRPQTIPNRVAPDGVEPDRRLVEDEHAGPVDERLSQLEPAHHAAGVRRCEAVGRFLEIHGAQHLVDTVAALAPRHVKEPGEHRDVLAPGELPVGRELLGYVADEPAR